MICAMSIRALLLVAVCLLGASACTNEITASLELDGTPFQPTSCQSGERNNFMGVDLIEESGRMLRLANSPANQPIAIVMVDGTTTEIGPCGQMTVQRQNSTINDITNVEGNATVECEGKDHSVKGTVTFKNCH